MWTYRSRQGFGCTVLAIAVALAAVVSLGALSPAAARQGGVPDRSAVVATRSSSCGGANPLLSLLGPLSETACLLKSLRYEFHTVTVDASGRRIVRTQHAIVGLQSRINLDGKGTAELVGKVKPSGGLDKLTLTINRLGAKRPPIAASVEVVAADPTGSIGAENIAFGYDQLDGSVPDSFTAEVDLGDLLDDAKPTLALGLTQVAASGSTNLIAATFDGTADQRHNKVASRMRYERSPGTASLSYLMTEPGTLELTTDRPGAVTGALDFVGDQDSSVEVTARDMPNIFDVDFSLDTPRIRYTGSDADGAPRSIGELDVRIESDAPLFGRANQLRAAIKGLPSGTELTADSVGGEFSLIATAPIDSVEVFAGSRAEQVSDLPPAGTQGVRYDDRTGEPFVVGARIFGLRALRARVSDTTTIDAVTGGGPFSLAGEIDGLSASAQIDDLPARASLRLDAESATFAYVGSSAIDRVRLVLESDSPLVADATEFALTIEDLPTEVELAADIESGAATFAANAPLGLVELLAKSAGAQEDLGPLAGGESGVVLRSGDGEFFLFGRVRGLKSMSFSSEPMALATEMLPRQPFLVDAIVAQEDGPTPEIRARLEADALPTTLDLQFDESQPGDGVIHYRASEPIGQLSLDVSGVELLEGADTAKAVIHGLPTAVDISFPATGPLAMVEADAPIGQVRLAAGSGSVVLPERSIAGDPVLHDLFRFENTPGRVEASARITALQGLTVSLDPINVTLRQDAAKTRPIDLAGTFDLDSGDQVGVDAVLDKPGASTSLSVEVPEVGATRLVFNNSAEMRRFDLRADGLPGVESFNAVFDRVSPRLSICLDPGPECRRNNPHVLPNGGANGGRPYAAEFSMDFEDFGTHVPGQLTTLNATIVPAGQEPVVLEDMRFENLSMDMGRSGSFKGACSLGTSVPRMYVFMDSRNRPFVVNLIKSPPALRKFQIGSDSDVARATTRIAWLQGCDGFQFRSEDAGTMDCGGAKHMVSGTGVDALDRPRGQVLPLCGVD
jgi:hypothetical protein